MLRARAPRQLDSSRSSWSAGAGLADGEGAAAGMAGAFAAACGAKETLRPSASVAVPAPVGPGGGVARAWACSRSRLALTAASAVGPTSGSGRTLCPDGLALGRPCFSRWATTAWPTAWISCSLSGPDALRPCSALNSRSCLTVSRDRWPPSSASSSRVGAPLPARKALACRRAWSRTIASPAWLAQRPPPGWPAGLRGWFGS